MKISEIEKGINVPTIIELKPLFSKMEIGDSILVTPTDSETTTNVRGVINSAVHNYNDKTGKFFISKTRQQENGIRIWRVK